MFWNFKLNIQTIFHVRSKVIITLFHSTENTKLVNIHVLNENEIVQEGSMFFIYRMSHELRSLLRESVSYVKIYRYNPKHLCPKLNGYGDNDQRKVWSSGGSTHCTLSADSVLQCWPRLQCQITEIALALQQYSASQLLMECTVQRCSVVTLTRGTSCIQTRFWMTKLLFSFHLTSPWVEHSLVKSIFKGL
jgi:hypothetical protein